LRSRTGIEKLAKAGEPNRLAQRSKNFC
jgi:hypothetical protein